MWHTSHHHHTTTTMSSASAEHTPPPAPLPPPKRARIPKLTVHVYSLTGNKRVVPDEVVSATMATLAECRCEDTAHGPACVTLDEFVRRMGNDGHAFICSFEEPFYIRQHDDEDPSLCETYEVIGPDICPTTMLTFGRNNYPDGVTLHASLDTEDSTHVPQLVLHAKAEATHSALCKACRRRTTCNDDDGVCLDCGALVMCTACDSSIIYDTAGDGVCPECAF